MTTGDAAVHCRQPTWVRVAAVPVAGLFFSPWLLLTAVGPALPLAVIAFCAALSAVGVLLLVDAFSRDYRADARGISWRDPLGRRRHAPWSEVREVRARQLRGLTGANYGVVLASGRSLTWDSSWREAAALYEFALAATDRGAYRSVGDRTVDVPVTFGERPRFALLELGLLVGVSLASLGFVGGGFWIVLTIARAQGDLGPPIAFASTILLPAVFGCLALLRTCWGRYRDPTGDVVTLDALGFSVRRGEDRASARWDEVVAVVRERVGGVDRLRVEAASVGFVAGPLALQNGIAFVVAERVPPAVREAWGAAEEVQGGDVPVTTAPDTFRHRLRVLGLAPWFVDVLAVFFITLPLLFAVAMRPDDDPFAVAPQRLLFVAGLAVAAVLVHRLTRAACFIEVSPDGCTWSGLRHRRRFAWSDVVALSLPDARTPRPLTITLSGGARLRHLDLFLAGHAQLLRSLRTHLPHLVG